MKLLLLDLKDSIKDALSIIQWESDLQNGELLLVLETDCLRIYPLKRQLIPLRDTDKFASKMDLYQ